MIKKNGYRVRTVKKIKYVRRKKSARNNLKASVRKLMFNEINGDY